ncbi:methylated-DNA--[protein]-cysteine S-methyltransferase [Clostridium sp.]|uniref:methylated-DNA--[protein]-cysteine S-methyltransferase n=1 Tax=Clostridium sp. TaxID=1506 RepID=UPI003F3C8C0F
MNKENNDLFYDEVDTPIGRIYIVMKGDSLKRIEIIESQWVKFLNLNSNIKKNIEVCRKVKTQILEYFEGKRKSFDINISLEGTPFRLKVWEELLKINYGETTNYGEIAKKIGNPKSVRAIGQANRSNPIPIIVPCHRVISKSGKLIGYAGNNTDIQLKLIEHEEKFL